MIPSWNGCEILERNLPSVEAALSSYPAGGETIVVDDGSDDGTASWLESAYPRVRIVRMPSNEGFAAATNAGVAAARCPLVVLLNNDMRVEQSFLAPLLLPFASIHDLFATSPAIVNRTFGGDEGVTACTFRLGLFETTFPERCGPSGSGARDGPVPARNAIRDRLPGEILFACGGAAAFDRAKWLVLGGLDRLYAPFYWEDVDLSWRARKRGWRVVHEPSSVVHHEHGATIGARFEKRRIGAIYERNRLLFQWKNLTSLRLTATHLAWLPLRLMRALAGRPEFLRGFGMAIGALDEALRARRFEKSMARREDEAILLSFGGGAVPR